MERSPGERLHQNWMRDYDPTTGRFLQADPLGLIAGMNVYGYANQSPMSYIDPNGESPILAAMLAGAALGMLFEALNQLAEHGLNFYCWDPYSIGKAGLIGGAVGGIGGIGSLLNPLLKAKGIGKTVNWKGGTRLQSYYENSRFIGNAYFKNATSGFGASKFGQWFNRSGLNSTFVSWKYHARTDATAFNFLSKLNKGAVLRRLGEAPWSRFPPWMFGGAGAIVDSDRSCACEP